MPKVATFNLTGISGKKYTFDTYQLGTSFKSVGAVYCVTKRYPKSNRSGYCQDHLYVGQTGDLSKRFVDHHKEDAWNRHGATHINILMVSIEKERLLIERDLIDGNDPCCNDC